MLGLLTFSFFCFESAVDQPTNSHRSMTILKASVISFVFALSGAQAFAPSHVTKLTASFLPSSQGKSSPVALNFHSGLLKSEEKSDTDVSEEKIRSLFYLWNDALATGDSRLVAKRYASDAILLATVSDEPRTDPKGIKNYFDNFLKLKPQVCSILSAFSSLFYQIMKASH